MSPSCVCTRRDLDDIRQTGRQGGDVSCVRITEFVHSKSHVFLSFAPAARAVMCLRLLRLIARYDCTTVLYSQRFHRQDGESGTGEMGIRESTSVKGDFFRVWRGENRSLFFPVSLPHPSLRLHRSLLSLRSLGNVRQCRNL